MLLPQLRQEFSESSNMLWCQMTIPVSPSVSESGKAILMHFSPLSLLSPLVTSGDLFVFTKYFPPHFSLCSHIIIFRTEYCNYMFGPQRVTSYLATLSLKWHLINIFLQSYQSWWIWGLKKLWAPSCHTYKNVATTIFGFSFNCWTPQILKKCDCSVNFGLCITEMPITQDL